MLFTFSFLLSIEVGGHLTEDTTWSPDNNPYLVTEILYVDVGVTLAILPGTEVKVSGASCTSWQEFDQNFWLYGGVSIAKFIQVDGKIIAEGTEQDSIIFTRMQDDPNYNWGTIYITEDAELCKFKYCKVEHSCAIGIAISYISKGLAFFNGKGIIRNCDFINNSVGVSSSSFLKEIEIINNSFIINNNINPFLLSLWKNHIVSYRINIDSPDLLVCNNNFTGYNSYRTVISRQLSFAYNTISNCSETNGNGYYYDNSFNNCYYGIRAHYEEYSLFIKKNRFIGGYEGININHAYVEISDNYFEGCKVNITGSDENSFFVRNFITDASNNALSGIIRVISDNVIKNSVIGLSGCGNELFSNNVLIDNEYIFSSITDNHIIQNMFLLLNDELYNNYLYGNPIFRNCILDFELPPECIDGGGNIWVDSLEAQTLFEDIQNGDFHLIEGSLAIDAGFDTTGYYCPFDMDYNHRVWDGDNNGTDIIDIGPYEYNSPAFGGIEGYTYKPTTGEHVDYVLLKINNQPGEFTFSDSVGNFQCKLPAGVYDVYAERVFYEDVIQYGIEVFDGQFTQVEIPMAETVDVENIQYSIVNFQLRNYPNPFNPSTTISSSIPNDSYIELSIFNIKGQKVKQLVSDHISAGEHSVIWNGKDSNNKAVASGIYFYRMLTKDFDKTKRMLLLK